MLEKIIKKNIFNQQGTGLIEMMFAVSLFAVLIVSATSIFQSVVQGQRSAVAAQNTQESMRYAFEVMSKEIRTAFGDLTGSACDSSPVGPPAYKVYNTSESGGAWIGDQLYFENKNGECVEYFTEINGGVNRLKIKRGIDEYYLTPDEINVTGINFTISDDVANSFHSLQPLVTISITVEMSSGQAMHKQKTTLQTTISSRRYE